ncbi:MAG: hypothetical protein U1D98_05410 [Candidatus Gracilibacteria bacterium]|nr:hypothetical protein [Candidatus Gracilibacteria bacterium]
MLRWNNVYGSDAHLHIDTVEQARDVINLFAGKTPERRPHDEIEDERERILGIPRSLIFIRLLAP